MILLVCDTAISAFTDGAPFALTCKFARTLITAIFLADSRVLLDVGLNDVAQPVNADEEMQQLKDTLKQIEGSVDTALTQIKAAKALQLETRVESLKKLKSTVSQLEAGIESQLETNELKEENAELHAAKGELQDQLEQPLRSEDGQLKAKIGQLEDENKQLINGNAHHDGEKEDGIVLSLEDQRLKEECESTEGCVFHAPASGHSTCTPVRNREMKANICEETQYPKAIAAVAEKNEHTEKMQKDGILLSPNSMSMSRPERAGGRNSMMSSKAGGRNRAGGIKSWAVVRNAKKRETRARKVNARKAKVLERKAKARKKGNN